MSWLNVRLILVRELRDQFRDRRTLFMIAVLPILLYPLLGMSFVQVRQFLEEKPSKVLIVGVERLTDLPPLVEDHRFAKELFGETDASSRSRLHSPSLLELHFARGEPGEDEPQPPSSRSGAHEAVLDGQYDAAVYFPPDFADRLEAVRQFIHERTGRFVPPASGRDGAGSAGDQALPTVPRPEIIYSTANEKSQIAFARLYQVLNRWKQAIVREKLIAIGLPGSATDPFDVDDADVAEEIGHRGAAVWSKILPIFLILWAMTGAFYPAVDLCAGEKERGTLETLLCSPARRSEIVLGKLLTIMVFSMATAVWNLATMGLTGWLIFARLPEFGPPPPMAPLWLALALVPVSALFGALCLALAAFARSTKEGQYYLMPLLLITMPLVILPVAAPGVELSLGNSLVPVMGLVLLLRSMLEGNVVGALPFVLPVGAVTLGCCYLAIRWAIEQFNSESVLFRESERLEVRLWVRHLIKDRGPTPTVAAAVFCGMAILLLRFFVSLAVPQPDDYATVPFSWFATSMVIMQLAAVVAPALLMTVMLTGSPRRTLLLSRPRSSTLLAAALLAIMVQPVVQWIKIGVMELYPPDEANRAMSEGIVKLLMDTPYWQVLLVMAVLPAVCEEFAFRGFILSGFRHLGHKWRAIVYTSLFFGATHFMLQQSIVAFILGILIGYLAVQSGSILPGVVFHLVHNGLGLLTVRLSEEFQVYLADWWAVAASGIVALGLLFWFHFQPYAKSAEEEQYEALRRAS
ncbi:MAG: ABC transporter permease subunit/CPBP intramembrane protease [Planctomycetota bacterium]|jgi:sodium transport system permease protein